MTTLPTLTTYAADACDARIPHEFDAERVYDAMRTANTLRAMRETTPKIAARRGLTTVALDALIMWLDWTFGEEKDDA